MQKLLEIILKKMKEVEQPQFLTQVLMSAPL